MYCDLGVRADGRCSVRELEQLGYACAAVNVTYDSGEKPKEADQVQLFHQKGHAGQAEHKLKQVRRITLRIDDMAAAQQLNASPVTKGYDIVAVEAGSPKVFQYLCEQGEIDLITFDLASRLPFQPKHPWIWAALRRSIHFEVTYGPALGDSSGRRYFFANASNIIRLTGGKNIVLSSGATRDMTLRSPYDAINIGLLLGLNYGQAASAVSSAGVAVLAGAEKRRGIRAGVVMETTEDDADMSEL